MAAMKPYFPALPSPLSRSGLPIGGFVAIVAFMDSGPPNGSGEVLRPVHDNYVASRVRSAAPADYQNSVAPMTAAIPDR